jgi:hypothetical protein
MLIDLIRGLMLLITFCFLGLFTMLIVVVSLDVMKVNQGAGDMHYLNEFGKIIFGFRKTM